MLVFKLLLTPVLIGLVSLAGRRWGPAVSGWLVGLPLTAGPVALFLALGLGTAFASRAAQGAILGLVSLAGFCLTYSWLSFRTGWLWSLLVSWGVFFVLTFALERVSLPLVVAFLGVISLLTIVLKLLPSSHRQVPMVNPPGWEILLRMFVATAVVVILTAVASSLGPQLSGLLSTFPLYASILAVFTHRFQDAAGARRLLRGLITGIFTFAIFFLLIAALVERWGIVVTFGLATLIALLLHGCSLWLMRRYSTSPPC
jgi:hypothetical protein